MNIQAFFSCGFRPFFLASSVYAFLLLFVWGAFWNGLPMPPNTAGGQIIWHAHELIFGFGIAAIIGFLTTAVPEFTGQKEIRGKNLVCLLMLWLSARICFWMSGTWGVLPSAISNGLLLVVFLMYLLPAVWNDPGRRHMSFVYVMLALTLLQCGFHYDLAIGGSAIRWLNASLGAFTVMIIVALSRISMRAINGLEESIELHNEPVEYIARPPRRNMAIFCITLYTVLDFFTPLNPINGWVAFASAAAMLNLLNDWHIGRAFFNRWIVAMYSIYCAIALSYGLGGYSVLFDPMMLNASKHILAIGGVALAVLLVQIFAGQVHCGNALTYYPWISIAILSLFASMIFRMLLPFFPSHYVLIITVSATLWMLSFALYVFYFSRSLLNPASDGRTGCL